MSQRILIRGATFENKGAEAMIRSVQSGIIAAIPDAVGLLDLTRGAEWSPAQLRGLEPRAGLRYHGRGRQIIATVVGGVGRIISPRAALRCVEAVTGVDARIDFLVDITGYGVGDVWTRTGAKGLVVSSLMDDVKLLAMADVPSIYLPQAWGPFRKWQSRRSADQLLRSAMRLYARDRESLEWLKTLPSCTPEKVSLASDIAFSFEGAPREVGRELLESIGIPSDEAPLVGIVPNMRVYERTPGEGRENTYVDQLISVARHFAGELGCQVVVMPHEIKQRPAEVPDDRYLCGVITEALSSSGNLCAALNDYSAEQLKAMIGEIDLLISSRFHSIVAAMSLRVPVVSIAWAHKYRELMKSVGLREYVLEHNGLDDGMVVDMCDQAWNRRQSITESLEKHVPAHELSAVRVLNEAVALMKECLE